MRDKQHQQQKQHQSERERKREKKICKWMRISIAFCTINQYSGLMIVVSHTKHFWYKLDAQCTYNVHKASAYNSIYMVTDWIFCILFIF